MFNPVPPQGQQPPDFEPVPIDLEIAEPPTSRSVSPRFQILAFAVTRGLLVAVLLGGFLGLVAGAILPEGVLPFYSPVRRQHVDEMVLVRGPIEVLEEADRSAMLRTWPIVTILALLPFTVLIFTVAASVQVLAHTIRHASLRNERAVKRSLEQRFDSHL
jgi:hypothetical protein